MDFTLHELGMAYRKAKVDLYYSMIPRLEEIAVYEENLEANLERLLDQLNSSDEDWAIAPTFLGCWTYVPKSIEWEKPDEEHTAAPSVNGFIESSPERKWRRMLLESANQGSRAKATFRLMALCSLDMHVVSTLWVMRVGHRFDAALGKSAYGSRIRRAGEAGAPNQLSLGTFKPYFWPFREWRDSGIAAMRDALDEEKKVIALTGDITSYYHRLDPVFLEDADFQQLAEVQLETGSDQKLNRLFVAALQGWAAMTPAGRGLPVGLPASAVVANSALLELDRFFEREVVPLYYGRYVDDVMLVMENAAGFESADEVWEWLFNRTTILGKAEDGSKSVAFAPGYLSNSTVHFSNAKNKVFLLEGASGRTLVDSIERTARERASEWRALPDLPRSESKVATDLISATQTDGESADNLRKADVLTMRRAGFAIKLRDFEAYERDLETSAWAPHRYAFFEAVLKHVLELPNYFDLAQYLPRVVRLATICQDFQYVRKILDAVNALADRVDRDCTVSAVDHDDAAAKDILSRWRVHLGHSLEEAVVAAFPPKIGDEGLREWELSFRRDSFTLSPIEVVSGPEVLTRQNRLFVRDLAQAPFRFFVLADELASKRGVPAEVEVPTLAGAVRVLDREVVEGIHALSAAMRSEMKLNAAVGLLFATRPLNLHEVLLSIDEPYSLAAREPVRAMMLALRGFVLNDRMPVAQGDPGREATALLIPRASTAPEATGKRSVALASWKTGTDSWTASVVRMPEPDLRRYSRLNQLVNQVLKAESPIDYLLFPELAIPPRWFLRLAQKLQGRGISLVSGVDYIHDEENGAHVVRNQVWAALAHDGLDFPSMLIIRQDKQNPAPSEKRNLSELRDLKLAPKEKRSAPMVIQHGDFAFAMLICSELTNIDYRFALRGRIDALFVPEWNKDTTSFGALVESAALDLHAFIVQCNDRRYGDSRIRAPYKDSWRRDVVRIKGGTRDYFVVGDIDHRSLRQFQSSSNSPGHPFKPIPDGFDGHERAVLPVSN